MWLAVTLTVPRERAEPLSDALLAAGALSADISDADAGTAHERPVFDEPIDGLGTGPGGVPSPGWSRARIAVLFAADADLSSALGSALAAAGMDAATSYEVHRVNDEDWVRRTQAQFAPQRIAPRLWIVPSWHAPPDPSAINILLDPGLAFGTGTHATTRLALRWLVDQVRGGERVIDFGCGSGILAIAAAKLGAQSVSGVDIDPHAVTAARANAERNGVAATFVSAAEHLRGPADIIVANILAQPLVVLAPLVARLTARAGRIALSGILAGQSHEVRQAYAPWYDFGPEDEEEGWVLVSGTRAR